MDYDPVAVRPSPELSEIDRLDLQQALELEDRRREQMMEPYRVLTRASNERNDDG
jgi:hypothetical protein